MLYVCATAGSAINGLALGGVELGDSLEVTKPRFEVAKEANEDTFENVVWAVCDRLY